MGRPDTAATRFIAASSAMGPDRDEFVFELAPLGIGSIRARERRHCGSAGGSVVISTALFPSSLPIFSRGSPPGVL